MKKKQGHHTVATLNLSWNEKCVLTLLDPWPYCAPVLQYREKKLITTKKKLRENLKFSYIS